MKLGIFSDIHGNGLAFECIFSALEKEKCDAMFFLGDICGYYYDQRAVIDRLNAVPHLFAIRGNHDSLFLRALEDSQTAKDYSLRYGRSFEFLRESITSEQIGFLKDLPMETGLEDFGIAAFHGSPWNVLDEYVYPDSDFAPFDNLPYRLVLLGHTHYPMDIRRQGIRIVNPGSSGQPRDGDWPSFAVYETGSEKLEVKRIKYSVGHLIEDIKRRKEDNPYLIRILKRMKEST
jgi:putative phosphoesterase